MSKKYLTGSKRLAIITRWLNGIDDPNFEVFPTRKEGKYIVKPRKTNLNQTTKDTNEECEALSETKSTEQPEQDRNEQNESEQESIEECEALSETKPKVATKVTREIKSIPKPKIKQTNVNTPNQFYDPTINIEILNQLKLLGEEFKMEREKKEQKRMIKEVVQKQITKPRMKYNYTDPDYTQHPNQNIDMIQTNDTDRIHTDPRNMDMDTTTRNGAQITSVRRRNNIFADVV